MPGFSITLSTKSSSKSAMSNVSIGCMSFSASINGAIVRFSLTTNDSKGVQSDFRVSGFSSVPL